MNKVAIITVNYNGREDTLELLKSLKLLKNRLEVKIIVVDNGSEDGSVGEVGERYPEIDILQAGQNLGYAGGYNKGIEYGQIWGADYFLIINNDCLIKDSSLLEELIKTIKSDDSIGLVSPKIYFAKGFEFHKDRYGKSDLGKVIWFAGGYFDWDNIGSIHRGLDEVDWGQYDNVSQAEIFSGACVLIKKEVLEKIKQANKDYFFYFNEKYFLYFEDSEFAKKVLDAGFKIYYNGKTAIYHKVSQSTGVGSTLTDYYHTRNRLIFGMEYGKLRTKFALFREAFKLLIFGRSAQRQGVLDYLLGKRGGAKLFHLEGGSDRGSHLTSGRTEAEYPLKLSIGIVNYNTADLTRKLVESIFRKDSGFRQNDKEGRQNDKDGGMEVIVLDNGNTDPCKQAIKEYLLASPSRPKVRYLKNEENEGFSKGYNKTIKYSLGEYYLMLNSDIEVLKNGLKEIIEWADKFKGEAVLGGKLVFPDGESQDSAFHLPTLWGAFKEYFLAQKGSYFMFQPEGEKGPVDLSSKPSKVEGMVMACLLIPKKILHKVGFLDEGTFIFFEDIEYARRLKQFGVPLYFVPTAKFIHHHGASTKRIGVDQANEMLKKSAEYYHGKFYYFLLSWVLRIGQKLGRVKTPVSRWVQMSK